MKKKTLKINSILKSEKLTELLQKEDINEIRKIIKYEEELENLQIELIKLQNYINNN